MTVETAAGHRVALNLEQITRVGFEPVLAPGLHDGPERLRVYMAGDYAHSIEIGDEEEQQRVLDALGVKDLALEEVGR